jgi:ketosteroid isomerase-like protein
MPGRADRRRSLEERLLVRFPLVARVAARALMRLSPSSRVRRAGIAHFVRQQYAAANRRDFEVVLVGLDPAFEYRPSRDLAPPDVEEVFRGHEGYLRLWEYWLDAFGDIRWDPQEILDLGQSLLVTTEQRGRGVGSGVAVSKPVFQLFTVRDGMIARQDDFLDRSEALAAAAGAPVGWPS